MKKILAVSLALFALSAIPAVAAPPAAPQPQGGVPAPRILVINRAQILQASKVGLDILRQGKAFGDQAQAELAAKAKALQAQAQVLQQQVAILAPDVKQKKVQEFEEKQNALQGEAQRREQTIQYSMLLAQRQIEVALEPILAQLMAERGGNMILDQNAVVFANNNAFNITGDAINRLNAKLSSLKVSLVSPPAGQGLPQR